MLQDIKHTIKQSLIYGISRVSTKLVSFILLPLYSLNFPVSEYGIIVRIEALWQILWSIFLFGLESGVVRWYTQIQDNNSRKRFLFTVTLFILVVNAIFTFIFYHSSGVLSNIIFKSYNYSHLIFYSSLIASIEALAFIIFLLIRINEKAIMYTTFSILISLLNLGLQYYYITSTQTKLEGIFIAKILAPLIVLIIMLPYYIKFLRFGFESKTLFELISYSFPIMLATLAATLLNQIDRYILGFLTNSDEVGIYGLGYNICGLINVLVIAPFNLAFAVISWKKLKDDNAKRFFTKSVTYLFFTVLYFSIFISLFTPHFIKIFTPNPNYWLAKDIVPWIALSVPFYAILTIGIFSYYVTKKTNYILYFFLTALLINIVLNYLLIPHFNMYGAAISNFVSFLTLSIIFYSFSKNQYFFNYEWNKIFYMLLCAIITIFPFFYFNMESRLLQIILKLAALLLFPFFLYPFKFYEPIELERIKGFFNKYFFAFLKH